MQETIETVDISWAVKKYGSVSAAVIIAETAAANLMAKDEAWTEEDPLDFINHYITYLQNVRFKSHAGDCNKARSWRIAAITCPACVYDDYMLKVWQKMKQEEETAQ